MPAGPSRTLAGPAYITNAATNLYNPGANTYALVKHIRLSNTDTSARTVTLYKGLTGGSAGGTEIVKAKSIALSDYIDIYFPSGDKYVAADFLSGLASVTNVVVIEVFGELYAI